MRTATQLTMVAIMLRRIIPMPPCDENPEEIPLEALNVDREKSIMLV